MCLAAVVFASAGVAAWLSIGSGPARIGFEELRRYPPIAFVWAPLPRAHYTGSGDLYLIRADGTGLRRLKAWPGGFKNGQAYGASEAQWSPDPKQLALTLTVWYDDPDIGVAVISSDGSRLTKIAYGPQFGSVAWSPDGRALLYAYGYATELWSRPVQGGRPRRIWRIRHREDLSDALWDPDWAPNGRYFAASTRRGIVKVRRDGSEIAALTRFGSTPRWSPDGRTIAFLRPRGEREDLYVVGADGHRLRRLIPNAGAPLWSPDGRSILFTGRHISLARADGTRVRTLTSDSGDIALAWSPDGRKILFLRNEELWVMDADGGGQTRLPFNRPKWSVVSADWGL